MAGSFRPQIDIADVCAATPVTHIICILIWTSMWIWVLSTLLQYQLILRSSISSQQTGMLSLAAMLNSHSYCESTTVFVPSWLADLTINSWLPVLSHWLSLQEEVLHECPARLSWYSSGGKSLLTFLTSLLSNHLFRQALRKQLVCQGLGFIRPIWQLHNKRVDQQEFEAGLLTGIISSVPVIKPVQKEIEADRQLLSQDIS